MHNEIKCYLAGPITGLSWEEAVSWRIETTKYLSEFGIQCISPMRAKEVLKGELKLGNQYNDLVGVTGHDIFEKDKFDCSRADILLVNFMDGLSLSIGALFELAWGHILGKYCVVVGNKDSECINHPFVKESASIVFYDLENALDWIGKNFGD